MSEKYLCLDCSNRMTSFSFAEDLVCLGESNVNLGRSQASSLPVLVEFFGQSLGIGLWDLDWIGLAAGPGYFTGIRIGLAYGLALASGLNIPVVPISSLEALAYSANPRPGEILIPCIRAGEGSAYSSGFAFQENSLAEVIPEGERSFEELSEVLKSLSCPFRIPVTEKRTCSGLGWDGFLEPLFCIGGSALVKAAWAHRSESVKPKEVRARYYRSPGVNGPWRGTASLGGESVGEGV